MSNQIVSRCPKCGTTATFTATFTSDIGQIVKADAKFKETHRSCPTLKTIQGPELTDEQIDNLLDRYLNLVKHTPRKKSRWAWIRRLFNNHAK